MTDSIVVGIIVGLAIGSSTYIWNCDNFTKAQKIFLLICIVFPPLQWVGALLIFIYNKITSENSSQRLNEKRFDKNKQTVNIDVSNKTMIFLFSIVIIILVFINGVNFNPINIGRFFPKENETEDVGKNAPDEEFPKYVLLNNVDLAHKLNKDYFVGKWICDNSVFNYYPDGTFSFQDKNGGTEYNSVWEFREGKLYTGNLHRIYIVDYSKNQYSTKTEESDSTYVFRRMN